MENQNGYYFPQVTVTAQVVLEKERIIGLYRQVPCLPLKDCLK